MPEEQSGNSGFPTDENLGTYHCARRLYRSHRWQTLRRRTWFMDLCRSMIAIDSKPLHQKHGTGKVISKKDTFIFPFLTLWWPGRQGHAKQKDHVGRGCIPQVFFAPNRFDRRNERGLVPR